MRVEFRECDFFDLWIWFEFEEVPSNTEQQYFDEILNSWFLIGKLGGYNAENLQVQDTGHDISYMVYDEEVASNSMMALMHNMNEVEYQGRWGRCWFDLGTSDALALDVLINLLKLFSKEYVAIARVIIGGQNEDWPIPRSRMSASENAENN
jgi:hypothetical protein